jgi:hypothetical protein
MAYRRASIPRRFHTVAETEGFIRDCREAGLADAERAAIVDAIARNPRGGDVIPESGGARKVRVAAPGRGKSGGYRLIAAYLGDEAPAYLLALYLKGDKANLSKAEVTDLRKLLVEVKRYWKERSK